MRKIVLASRNADKVREMKQLFDGMGFEIQSAEEYPGLPEVIEDGTTITGNARRKAIVTAAYTGEIAVADDTSLEVRELVGLPDIFAARFSGVGATYESNVKLLLEMMAEVPEKYRQARFSTGCAWVDPRPQKETYQVLAPAAKRWLRNPWGGNQSYPDSDGEWDFWNTVSDHRRVWQTYRRAMENDLVGWGHDKSRLREVADGLFAGVADALYPGERKQPVVDQEGIRLPDTRIWSVPGPDTQLDPPTRYAPSGMPSDAPGLHSCGSFWLEITVLGKLMGRITEQPIGRSGFGYDPVFRPETDSRTLAEMPADEKNRVSHRGKALRRLMTAVKRAY